MRYDLESTVLDKRSITLTNVVDWKFETDNDWGYSKIPVDEELIAFQWTMEGNVPYAIQINDEGEVEFIEVDKYVPKKQEFVLTPINL